MPRAAKKYTPKRRTATGTTMLGKAARKYKTDTTLSRINLQKTYTQPKWRENVLDMMSATQSRVTQCQSALVVAAGTVVLSTRALYQSEITNIQRQTITALGARMTLADKRMTASIFLKGWKFDIGILNTTQNAVDLPPPRNPSIFNYAILQSKNQPSGVAATGFFRDFQTSRDVDFGTGISGSTMCFEAINTDKFHVLLHKRVKLGAGYENDTPSNNAWIHKYVPFNRKVVYNDDGVTTDPASDACENPIYLVYWFDDPFSNAGQPQVGNAWCVNIKAVAFFNDISD